MGSPSIVRFATTAVIVLLATLLAADLLGPIAIFLFAVWPAFLYLDFGSTRRLYLRSPDFFERAEQNRIFAALVRHLGMVRALPAFLILVEIPAFAFISLIIAPALGSCLFGGASLTPCLAAGAATLAFAHAEAWRENVRTWKEALPTIIPPRRSARLKIEKELAATDLGVKLKTKFVEEETSVRPPLLPSILHGFSGTVKIPKVFLSIFTKDELKCIFLHEAAHVKFKHFLKDFAVGAALFLIVLVLINGNSLAVIPAAFVAGISALVFHRRFEFEADEFAAKMVSKKAMISTLEKIKKRYGKERGFFIISHPSISARIKKLVHQKTKRQSRGWGGF